MRTNLSGLDPRLFDPEAVVITLRDQFAMHAPEVPNNFAYLPIDAATESPIQRMIRWRWHYADLMLAARGVA